MDIEKFHPTTVSTVHGSNELGQQIMAMRYDLVHETLQGMVTELERQITGDERRGRPMLAEKLRDLHAELNQATQAAEKLALFSKPWIDAEKSVSR